MNNQDIAQLLAAGGNAQLLGLGGINPLTGLPNPGPAPNGSATAGADALFQSLLQRSAVEKFAALQGLGDVDLAPGVRLHIAERASGVPLGEDANGRAEWSDNYQLTVDRPSAHRI